MSDYRMCKHNRETCRECVDEMEERIAELEAQNRRDVELRNQTRGQWWTECKQDIEKARREGARKMLQHIDPESLLNPHARHEAVIDAALGGGGC